jgi:glycosyltransferase involved in cell wall biosynthesis
MPKKILVSVVMPCLNEEKTVGLCVQKAKIGLRQAGVSGEVVVSDNGSTDSSVRVAQAVGARIVIARARGYGAALLAGIISAKGDWIVMGDSDNTYDFRQIKRLIAPLKSGYHLVIGSRLSGTVKKGAMPFLNRILGTPTLNLFLKLFYGLKISDSQSGMRAFTKVAFKKLKLKALGMEFASEMLVRAKQKNLRLAEVPVSYGKRIMPTKLSRFRDAWRHLRFMLVFAPTYVFLGPGVFLFLLGAVGLVLLSGGPFWFLGRSWDVHTQILASMLTILGSQVVMMGIFAKAFSWTQGFEDKDLFLAKTLRFFKLEQGLFLGLVLFLVGLIIGLLTYWDWAKAGFGFLWAIRPLVLAMTFAVLGMEIVFASFFLSILGIERK